MINILGERRVLPALRGMHRLVPSSGGGTSYNLDSLISSGSHSELFLQFNHGDGAISDSC